MGRLPARPGSFGAGVHEIRREAHDALIDQDDPERGQGVVKADLEAGVDRAELAEHIERRDAGFAPAQSAELGVALRLGIDEQELHRAAAMVEPLEQPGELGPDIGVGDPFRREDAGKAEPGDRLADAFQRLQLRPAQLELGGGRYPDGLQQPVDAFGVLIGALASVDREQRITVAAGYPVQGVAQLGRPAPGELRPDPGQQDGDGRLAAGQGGPRANEKRPGLLVVRVPAEQLIKAIGGLLDPRLAPAPQLAVYDAPLQVIPVTLEFVVGGG